MKYIVVIAFFLLAKNCDSSKKEALLGDTPWQQKMNTEYKDASQSPLKAKDLKTFKGLDFYPFDSSYVVKANFKLTPEASFETHKTTGDRLTQKRVFGIITFNLKGNTHQLNIYQDKELMQKKEYQNYLFLPFKDDTTGDTSYGGGRYIDLEIPEGNTIEIDFNKAYNPYCAYNDKYSCPLVPDENNLKVRVEAGVKAFQK